MSTKRSRGPAPQIQPGADNLTAIDGIGPALARHLNDAGIHTFAQLAALSPEEILTKIGHQAGLSAARIMAEDWIGQAGALTTQQASTPDAEQQAEHQIPETPPEEAVSRQRNATFTVELLLGVGGEVRRTSVAHIQSGHMELQPLCSGWDPARLVEYMVERAGLRVAEPSQGTIEQLPTLEPAKPLLPSLSGEPTLRALTAVDIDDDRSRNVLHHDQAFKVQLTLDLFDVVMPAEHTLSYAATVVAKRLGSGACETLGEAHGQISMADTLALDIDAGKLPEGLYRLEALVDLAVVSGNTKQLPAQKTQLKGGLLQIY